jgi:hypothetical protein
MSKRIVVLLCIIAGLLAACAANRSAAPQQPESDGNQYAMPLNQAQPGAVAAAPTAGTIDNLRYANESGADDQRAAQDRIILKSASLQIVVDDATATLASITQMATDLGGWVVNSSTSQVLLASGDKVARGNITVRVPAAKLDDALNRIKSGAGTVNNESVSGQDVTQEYVDLTSRLKNLQAAEEQLRAIMTDAKKTEDVLNVYNQLVSVRGDIETTKGQIQYYDEASAYSSIAVDVTPKAIETPIQIAGWNPGRTAQDALSTLVNVLHLIADLLITVALLVLPLGLLIGIPLYLLYRVGRRMGRRPARTAVTETPGT